MWQGVELREIRVFLLLAEELHFGRTAVRAGLTQSRVSQTLRSLERKLGVDLVHRTSRRVHLTAAGEAFRQAVAPALGGLEEVLRVTADAGPVLTEPVRIGVISAAAVGPKLRAMIARHEEAHPQSSVELVGLPFRDRFGPLRRGEVELMVTSLPLHQPDLVVGPVLSHEPRMLAVSRRHPLAGQHDISVEDLADHPIGDLDLQAPAELVEEMAPSRTPSGRLIPQRPIAAREPSELILAVAQGRIVQPVTSIFAASYRHPEVEFLPIRGLPPTKTAFAWRRRNTHRGLREFLRVNVRGPIHERS
jgi:DNA-binding transcriptional LysR family regulator